MQRIKFAYELKYRDVSKVNAYEVRALSSSLAWPNKIPLDDFVKAGFRSSENSFIRFYLRDTSGIARSLADLCPIVAAQKI